ncbi:MAG: HAMP domain-containing sensor histidine kinase [Thermoleophilia bacterium]
MLASEDLRGPLTSVSGYLQVLLDGEVGVWSPGRRARIESIAARNAQRMEQLLDSLIVLAQLTMHSLVAPEHVDVGVLVSERVRRATDAATARGLRLGVGVDVRGMVLGDAAALAHAVDTLVDGAIMFRMPGGTIEVLATETDGRITIEVCDDGLPLHPDQAAALLEGRPATAAAGTRALLGSRLGLFMVRMVVDAHGGTTHAELDHDERTRLRLELPCAPPEPGTLSG